jgi:uncharacterized protein (DUF4415 family)
MRLTTSEKSDEVKERFATLGAARTTSVRGGTVKKEYEFSKAKRGSIIPVPHGKTRVTIRLDNAILDWFRNQVDKAGGGNYQALINDALRDHIARKREPLESTIRRVIREELRRAG